MVANPPTPQPCASDHSANVLGWTATLLLKPPGMDQTWSNWYLSKQNGNRATDQNPCPAVHICESDKSTCICQSIIGLDRSEPGQVVTYWDLQMFSNFSIELGWTTEEIWSATSLHTVGYRFYRNHPRISIKLESMVGKWLNLSQLGTTIHWLSILAHLLLFSTFVKRIETHSYAPLSISLSICMPTHLSIHRSSYLQYQYIYLYLSSTI